MAAKSRTPFDNPVVEWIDQRLPLFTMMNREYLVFPTPKNFNYFWNFGAIATVMLLLMIATGFFLSMFYVANADLAFGSVQRIMRDVNYGWLIRYIHANGASMFFAAVYIHMFRGLYYGSYKAPRELLWILGCVIFLLMMATAFTGYCLPWGQMSFWGATVITNLFGALPVVGEAIRDWLWGGFAVTNATLNRFFSFHFILPFVILGVVVLHVWALHVTGSNNPTGIEPKTEKDTVPFHPYYTSKDLFGLTVFFIIYAVFVFWLPESLGHPDNNIPANPLATPAHIVPEWYFLPFYAILRAIPNKLLGVIAMFAAVLVLFVVPWLDAQKKIRSGRYRPIFKVLFWLLAADGILLGWCGANPPEGAFVLYARLGSLYYFFFFLVALPLLPKIEKTLPVPESINAAVLACKAKSAALFLAAALALGLAAAPALANEGEDVPHQEWAHDGMTGTYDLQAAQRGFQVYRQVCSSCHSMNFLHYRDLEHIGFSEEEVKVLAADKSVMDGPDESGEMFERPAIPADRFAAPFANDQTARNANGGALPPDLSLIVAAREGHEDYVYALLTSFIEETTDEAGNVTGWHYSANPEEAVPEDEVPEACRSRAPGQHCNLVFPGNLLSMAPPLVSEGQVAYEEDRNEGIQPTVGQMAHDVTTFLAFASDPHMGERKEIGLATLIFLIAFAGLAYAAKRKVWSKQK
jgi:ubiquinol-cytochrome c reductase cytochrome b/c1 subunit